MLIPTGTHTQKAYRNIFMRCYLRPTTAKAAYRFRITEEAIFTALQFNYRVESFETGEMLALNS